MLENENDIIKSAQCGDMPAFEQLVIEYEAVVYNTCFKLLNDEFKAKDASQETFIKVYKNLYKFNLGTNFKAWIYRIAYNTCLDIIRTKKDYLSLEYENEEGNLLSVLPSDDKTVEEKILYKERLNEIKKAVNKLPFEQKSLIVLRDIEDYSYNEISQIMNMPLGSVKSGISRARKKLKDILSKT